MSKELNAYISRTAKTTVDLAIKTLKNQNYIQGNTNYKKTEKLLKSYPTLSLHIDDISKDIKDIKREGQKRKSTDVVRYSGDSMVIIPEEEMIKEKINSIKKTRREIKRIDRALRRIKLDEYYFIIKEFYFGFDTQVTDPDNPEMKITMHQTLSVEEIAEKHEISERTVKRHKSRMINFLATILFGAE